MLNVAAREGRKLGPQLNGDPSKPAQSGWGGELRICNVI